jgi:hypothetical protein
VGTSTSHNPMGLYGLFQGYLYLLNFTLRVVTFITSLYAVGPFHGIQNRPFLCIILR